MNCNQIYPFPAAPLLCREALSHPRAHLKEVSGQLMTRTRGLSFSACFRCCRAHFSIYQVCVLHTHLVGCTYFRSEVSVTTPKLFQLRMAREKCEPTESSQAFRETQFPDSAPLLPSLLPLIITSLSPGSFLLHTQLPQVLLVSQGRAASPMECPCLFGEGRGLPCLGFCCLPPHSLLGKVEN